MQVELVLAQFRRAKGRVDLPDVELYEDLSYLYNRNDVATDPAVFRRLVEKLQLAGIGELTQESLALHEMVTSSGGDPGASIEKMSMLLKRVSLQLPAGKHLLIRIARPQLYQMIFAVQYHWS